MSDFDDIKKADSSAGNAEEKIKAWKRNFPQLLSEKLSLMDEFSENLIKELNWKQVKKDKFKDEGYWFYYLIKEGGFGGWSGWKESTRAIFFEIPLRNDLYKLNAGTMYRLPRNKEYHFEIWLDRLDRDTLLDVSKKLIQKM